MPQLKLIYLNVRGLGELPRLVMHYADVEFEDMRLDREQWMEMKSREYIPSKTQGQKIQRRVRGWIRGRSLKSIRGSLESKKTIGLVNLGAVLKRAQRVIQGQFLKMGSRGKLRCKWCNQGQCLRKGTVAKLRGKLQEKEQQISCQVVNLTNT